MSDLIQGIEDIAEGQETLDVVFASPLDGIPEVILAVVENTSEDPLKIRISATVTLKSATGFSVGFDRPPNTGNYKLVWHVSDQATIQAMIASHTEARGRRVTELVPTLDVSSADRFLVVRQHPVPRTRSITFAQLRLLLALDTGGPLFIGSDTVANESEDVEGDTVSEALDALAEAIGEGGGGPAGTVELPGAALPDADAGLARITGHTVEDAEDETVVPMLTLGQGSQPLNAVDILLGYGGAPAASELDWLLVTRPFFLPEGSVHHAYVRTVGTVGGATFDLKKNGTTFGSVVFAVSTATGAVTITTTTNFTPGDRVELVAPASPNATLANLQVGLIGYPR